MAQPLPTAAWSCAGAALAFRADCVSPAGALACACVAGADEPSGLTLAGGASAAGCLVVAMLLLADERAPLRTSVAMSAHIRTTSSSLKRSTNPSLRINSLPVADKKLVI